jgi:hypothetical protein
MTWEADQEATDYADAPRWFDIVYPAMEAMEADPPERRPSSNGDYSGFIYKAISFLEHAGVEVQSFTIDLPPHIAGRTIYEPRTIIKLSEPRARDALMTLMHEAGHVLSYWRLRRAIPDIPDDHGRRERWAYLHGWMVIRLLGIDVLISKDRWRDFHEGR